MERTGVLHTEDNFNQRGRETLSLNHRVSQQLGDEVIDLRRLKMPNAQPPAHPMFRITYQKPYFAYVDKHNTFPLNFKMPFFPTFSGEDFNIYSRNHMFKFSYHCVALQNDPNYKLRLFRNYLVGSLDLVIWLLCQKL